MKRVLAFVLAAIFAACGEPEPVDYGAVFDGTAGRWIDLTYSFGESTVYWPTDTAGFELTELASGVTPGGWFYASNAFASAEHGGTHLDAPIHFGFTALLRFRRAVDWLARLTTVPRKRESHEASRRVAVADGYDDVLAAVGHVGHRGT
ncbi:MAG: cyclase family protein [Gemmatimonadetes bacterium]|nr:cyclase family protein [Gemmatimonadota bacterium]MDA1103116.1 cyclase family protein [Gemmatimonadota bacterium]